MEIVSTFKIDKIDLKNNPNPDKLLQSYKDEAAKKLGMEIIKLFPYDKSNDSYEGELPEMSLNRDHQYMDIYEIKLEIKRSLS